MRIVVMLDGIAEKYGQENGEKVPVSFGMGELWRIATNSSGR
jgi:hypothetical protein